MRPNSEVWAVVQKEMQAPLKTDKAQQFGSAETSTEQQATARGLGSIERRSAAVAGDDGVVSSARHSLRHLISFISNLSHKKAQKHKNKTVTLVHLLGNKSSWIFEREVK